MCRSARLYNCARCHHQVVICSHCDRGNIYCSGHCATQSRLEKQQEAKGRYQSTAKGRHCHATRQQHYRQRKKQKVTYQGSVDLASYDLLLAEPEAENPVKKVIPPSVLIDKSAHYCHFCGCRCMQQIRWVFLHQQSSQVIQVHRF